MDTSYILTPRSFAHATHGPAHATARTGPSPRPWCIASTELAARPALSATKDGWSASRPRRADAKVCATSRPSASPTTTSRRDPSRVSGRGSSATARAAQSCSPAKTVVISFAPSSRKIFSRPDFFSGRRRRRPRRATETVPSAAQLATCSPCASNATPVTGAACVGARSRRAEERRRAREQKSPAYEKTWTQPDFVPSAKRSSRAAAHDATSSSSRDETPAPRRRYSNVGSSSSGGLCGSLRSTPEEETAPDDSLRSSSSSASGPVSSLNHPVSASEPPPSEGAAAITASISPPPCRPRAACLPPRARARS